MLVLALPNSGSYMGFGCSYGSALKRRSDSASGGLRMADTRVTTLVEGLLCAAVRMPR